MVRKVNEQMELAWRHKLTKAYLLTKEAVEAEQLILSMREQKDLSQATQIELTVDLAESLYLQGRYGEALELLLPLDEELTADKLRRHKHVGTDLHHGGQRLF